MGHEMKKTICILLNNEHGIADFINQLSTQFDSTQLICLKSDNDYWCFPPPHPTAHHQELSRHFHMA